MAYTLDFTIALGSSKTGLTLNAQIVTTAGVDLGSAITTGFTEIGNGNYLLHTTAIPAGHRGGIKFYESGIPGTILAFAAINPEEAERVDVALSTLATTTALTTVDSNVDAVLVDTGTTLPAQITALNNLTAAEVWAYATRTLTTAVNGVTAAEVWAYATRTLTAAVNGVTVVSAVSGSTITVYANDTWSFTVTDSSLALSGYEKLALVVKSSWSDADTTALLHVDDSAGLVRIGGTTPAAASNGTLTSTATSFTVLIAVAETDVTPGGYRWVLKGYDTTPSPSTSITLATGTFMLQQAALDAIS